MQFIKIYLVSTVILFSGCSARVAQQNKDTIKKNIIAPHANNIHIGKKATSSPHTHNQNNQNALDLSVPQPSKITDITSLEQFDRVIHSQAPAIIKFYMNGCSWCVKMNAVFKSLAEEFNAQGIEFYQINGPQLQANIYLAQATSNNYKISGYPYFLFINHGQPVNKILGGTTLENLQKISADLLK